MGMCLSLHFCHIWVGASQTKLRRKSIFARINPQPAPSREFGHLFNTLRHIVTVWRAGQPFSPAMVDIEDCDDLLESELLLALEADVRKSQLKMIN